MTNKMDENYGYPVGYYNMGKKVESLGSHFMIGGKPVKGSYWVPCSMKAKNRHSFCDCK